MKIKWYLYTLISITVLALRCGLLEPEASDGSLRVVLVKKSSGNELSEATAAIISVQAIVKKGSTTVYDNNLTNQGNSFHGEITGLEPGNDYSVLLYGKNENTEIVLRVYESGIIVRAGEESKVNKVWSDFIPTLKEPADNSTITDTTPTFEWNSVVDASSYELVVDNDSSFNSNSPQIHESNLDSTSYIATSSFSFGIYYWKVRSRDRQGSWGGWSEVWSFAVADSSRNIAFYPFNGTVNDVSGNGNHGTLLGGASVNSNFLLIGNNDQDALSIPNTVLDEANDFTISAMLRIDTFHTLGGFHPYNCFINSNSSIEEFEIFYDAPKDQWAIHTNPNPHFFDNATMEDGLWHHIIFVRESSLVKLFIDGGEVGDGTVNSNPLNIIAGSLILGQDRDSKDGNFDANQSWAGGIDNLRIYRRALDNDEIQQVYQLDRIVLPSGSVAFYPFNGTADDESGNGNHGTPLGGASVNSNFLLIGNNDQHALSIPNTVLDGANDFTISAMLKIDILHTSGGFPFNSLFNSHSSGDVFDILYRTASDQWEINTTGDVYSFGNTTIEDNFWHHAIFIRESSSVKLFIDGVEIGAGTVNSNPLNIVAGTLIMGQDRDSPGGAFDANQSWAGGIDNLRIYRRALGDNEIQLLFQFDGR